MGSYIPHTQNCTGSRLTHKHFPRKFLRLTNGSDSLVLQTFSTVSCYKQISSTERRRAHRDFLSKRIREKKRKKNCKLGKQKLARQNSWAEDSREKKKLYKPGRQTLARQNWWAEDSREEKLYEPGRQTLARKNLWAEDSREKKLYKPGRQTARQNLWAEDSRGKKKLYEPGRQTLAR